MKITNLRKSARNLLLSAIALTAISLAATNALPDVLAQLPARTWQLTKSDAIVVLGTPSNGYGKAGPIMRERVTASVDLLKQGLAQHVIFTGAAAHNKFVEAEVMADLARQLGAKSEQIVLEPHAQNTYQNAFNSVAIMKEHGWKSAIVVTSAGHLRRANFIFSHYPISYCMAGCKDPPEQTLMAKLQFDQREKFHLIGAIVSGQAKTFGLTEEQCARLPGLVSDSGDDGRSSAPATQ